METKSEFCKTFELALIKQNRPQRTPRVHQSKALKALDGWINTDAKRKGAILVMPTGSGKTFTAVRFLCDTFLGQGSKVLWLAHTHHLLEQAYYTFCPKLEEDIEKFGLEVALVDHEKKTLNLRLISGEQNHFKPDSIDKEDDVLFCTLQTAVRAFNNNHFKFLQFLKSCKRLMVVFDEAHHSPANTYGQLMEDLFKMKGENLFLLGLTATPTYSNELKLTYFKKLFPQDKLPKPEITVSELQAAKILSKIEVMPPVKILENTYKPTFSSSEFRKWINTFHNDIPEHIITELANSKKRNEYIANTYSRKEHGKTIIFADRWYQCEMIVQLLAKRGIKAGAIYSYGSKQGGNADDRNIKRRDNTQQQADLLEFKKQNSKLDVLVNINILTEGTDVPDVETVFITRQTTSEIRIRQMIGRALRGTEFGGTETSKVVLFEDNWQFDDILGEFAELPEDFLPMEFEKIATKNKKAYQLVSIDLIKQLSRAMNEGVVWSEALEFENLFPIGWYEAVYSSVSSDNEDELVNINKLLLVFKHEEKNYKELISYLKHKGNIDERFKKDLNISFENVEIVINKMKEEFFKTNKSVSSPITRNIFHLSKHFATEANGNEIRFHLFENRTEHNMDGLAQRFIENDFSPKKIREELISEYDRKDRYWKCIYPTQQLFFDHCSKVQNKLLDSIKPYNELPVNAIKLGVKVDDSPDSKTIEEIRLRDKVCKCCGEDDGRKNDVDHIRQKYFEKNHSKENLQLLCKSCHKIKSSLESVNLLFDFSSVAPQKGIKIDLEKFSTPLKTNKPEEWEKFMRRVTNFYYGCNAVTEVNIGGRGDSFYHWQIRLQPKIKTVPDQGFQKKLLTFINKNKPKQIDRISFQKM
jgi:superfamily II DNA or RNA helicase